jgi:hypothetical protein
VNHPAHLFRVAEEVLSMGEPCTGGSRDIGPRGRIGGGQRGRKQLSNGGFFWDFEVR